MPAAYSYLRFSSPQQAEGDSIRRQTEARERWLAGRPDATLDTSIAMTDPGRSGFVRKDWDTYALAQFIQHIKTGRVQKGSYLLVENLDRLSREDEGEATELFLSIVNKGVVVVQLMPAVKEFSKPVNVYDLMFAIMELSRGHSESKVKSERVGAAWGNKKAEARERAGAADSALTYRVPGWITVVGRKLIGNRMVGGTFEVKKDATAVVRRVFQMARDGMGVRAIAEQLNREGVPVLGRKVFKGRPVVWSETVVYYLLTSKAVIGEYQPCTGRGGRKTRQAAGEAIPNFYPAVIDRDLYWAVQDALKKRAYLGTGRPPKNEDGSLRKAHINVFAGLLTDARDGGTYTYKHHRTKPAVLIPVGAKHGRGVVWASFPARVFEEQILQRLHEIKARDLWPNGDAVHKVEPLAGQVAEVQNLVKVWTAKMDNPDIVDIVSARLAEYRTREKALTEQLAQAQREASSPPSETWGEMRSLVEVVRKAPNQDEARQRLKAAVRRVVEGVYCLFVGRGAVRVAAVEVWFTNGKRRCFLLGHEQARVGRPGRSWSLVLNGPWNKETGHANSLRDPKKVRQVLAKLATFDLPTAEELADATGDSGVQAWMTTDPAALLASLEYADPEQLPASAVARVRAVARACVQLGWPVFKE